MLSRCKCHAVDQILPPELANGTISFPCPFTEADNLEVRTYWLDEQRADFTIAKIMRCTDAVFKQDADEIELNLFLLQYLDV